MPDCLFCKICSHEISAKVVYEDDDAIAFLDIRPLSTGHTVVIPKIHAPTITTLPKSAAGPLCTVIQYLTQLIEQVLAPDGFNIGWNHGEAGGQTIDHLHIHIIPRWKGDGGGSIHSIVRNPPKEDLDEILRKLKGV